jgi:hypothetical protein
MSPSGAPPSDGGFLLSEVAGDNPMNQDSHAQKTAASRLAAVLRM